MKTQNPIKTPKKRVKKAVEPDTSATPKFLITLKLADKTYLGQGETSLEALQAIPKPLKIVSKGTLCIEAEGKRKEILMYPVRLKRLFYNKLFQEIQLKSLVMFMK